MPLGAPAIPGVRALQLRDVQVAIDRIRERFQTVESQLTSTTAQAGQSTLTLGQSNASISNLQRQLSALVSRVDAIGAPTDKLETFIAAAAIEQYDPVYVTTAGFVSPVSPTEPDAIYGVIGVATTAAALGASVVVRKSGTMQIVGAVFQAGGPVYAGLDGLTQFPDYVNVAVPVGVAVGTDQLDVTPGWPALQYPGVYSEFETFLPATWGLVRDAVQLTDDFNAAASGIVVKTGFDDVSTRTLQQPAAGITIANPAGTAGDPAFALANDLAALEGFSSTGIAVRTATDTWAQRSVVGTTDRVTVTNGSGAAGDPTVDIAATYVGQTSITTLGTVTTGTWQGTPIAADRGGTGVANAAGSTVTLGGALSFSGAFTTAITVTGNTSVTLPTSGTLATTAQLPAGANPTASVGLTAVNGAATTFMRSDGAPALDQGIAPTWTAAHRFNQAVGIGASNSSSTGSMLVVAGAQFNSLLVRSTGSSGGVGSSDIYLGSASSDSSGGSIGYDHTTNRLSFGASGAVKVTVDGATGSMGVGVSAPVARLHVNVNTSPGSISAVSSAVLHLSGADASGATLVFDSFASAPGLIGRRAQGTAAAKSAVQANQNLLILDGYGYGATAYSASSRGGYRVLAAEAWSDTANGTYLGLYTTPAGSAALAERIRVTDLGHFRVVSDNQEIQIGASQDLRLYHDGTDSIIENDTGILRIKSGGDLYLSEGQVALQTVGKGISIKEGTNAKMGISTMVGGTVVVSTTAVTASSRIMLTPQNTSGGAGSVSVSARTAGTSFTISSTNVLDTRDVAWVIFEPS